MFLVLCLTTLMYITGLDAVESHRDKGDEKLMHTTTQVKQHIKIGCEVFVIENGSLLLGQRKNCYGEGDWGLPGGHLEYGESLEAAAIRELKEELGIDAKDLTLKTVVDDTDNNGHYIHLTFLLSSYEGKITLQEPEKCSEWRFFPLDALPHNIFSAHKKILECFFREELYYKAKEICTK